MADAMEMMILSILAPQLHCEWALPSWQVALLTSVLYSTPLLTCFLDRFGSMIGFLILLIFASAAPKCVFLINHIVKNNNCVSPLLGNRLCLLE